MGDGMLLSSLMIPNALKPASGTRANDDSILRPSFMATGSTVC
jgi:hypothetical protein